MGTKEAQQMETMSKESGENVLSTMQVCVRKA
jgi:hypothetical protein